MPYLQLYAHRDAEEAKENAQKIVRLLSPPRDEPLLDLGCGAGRYLGVFRDLQFTDLVGLDLSEALLRVAARDLVSEREEGCQSDVELVQGDMRSIPYREHFSTVLSLFTSFGYFAEDEENAAALCEVYCALKPGGKFLIDYLNRDRVIQDLVACDEGQRRVGYVRNVRCLTQRGRRVEKDTLFVSRSGEQSVFHESVRLYSPSEMLIMLRNAGFAEIHPYGSLDGEDFSPDSPRLVIITKKEGGA
ncbi:MAG: class I SAM-dependent methyltransferase [Anaerolineales bacterium]